MNDYHTIDAYSHVFPQPFLDAVRRRTGGNFAIADLIEGIPALTDVDRRLELMDDHGVDEQVLTPASPPIETIADPSGAVDLARTMNDAIATIVDEHPDRFEGVATVPMNNPPAMVDELERAVDELGLRGALVYSNVDRRAADEPHIDGAGHPIDDPKFDPFYETAADLGVPLWLHPTRPMNRPEYVGEMQSKYLVWQMFGWPFELSAAMARLVFGGVFDRHPALTVIAHHAGGMVPLLAGRIDVHYELFEGMMGVDFGGGRERPYSDHFTRFYVDSATFGSTPALACAIDFFGVENVLFGTDTPFDAAGGDISTSRTIEAIEGLDLSEQDRERIYAKNVGALLER